MQGTTSSNLFLTSGPEQETVVGNNDHVVHTHTDSDEEIKRKGKGKMIKSVVKEGKRQYITQSSTQMVLGGAMVANAEHTQRRRQQ